MGNLNLFYQAVAKTENNPKQRNGGCSLVIMSRMDFEIARFVFERSTEIGLTPSEVSFLLGKKDAYFFDLLDPTDKNKFKTEQLDLLPAILDSTIREIIPNNIQPDEQVSITGSKKIHDTEQYKTITYRFTVEYKDKSTRDFIWKKKETKGERSKENEAVTNYLLKLIKEGYFDELKFALTIYLLLQENLGAAFTAKDIQTSLAILCRKQNKEPVLERKEDRSRFVYQKASLN